MADIPNNGIENAVGNSIYTDLVMTRYPENLDTRTGASTNPNMLRWKNLTDYNMAEHVNALQDALMSIQRALGMNPQIPSQPKDSSGNPVTGSALITLKQTETVKSRIDKIEDKNYDSRYGGPNWNTSIKQTLEEHRHTGAGPGHPSKIDLTSEVTGKLPRANIDLSSASTGVTGANILINATAGITIDKSVNEKLSTTEGGTIQKDLAVVGKTQTRWNREYDYTDCSGGTVTTDNQSLLNSVRVASGTTETTFIRKTFNGLYYGRYVMIVRAKTNNLFNGGLLNMYTVSKTDDAAESITLKGTDFKEVNKWQNFYLIFTHEPNVANASGEFGVRKLATTASVNLSLDYVLITPIHPAVFDR